MRVRNFKQQSITPHNFSMNPRAPVQRSSFAVRQAHKTAFSASYLVPIYCEEVMPGDMFNIRCDVVARTQVPVVPIQDNWTMDFFYFFIPNRIGWDNWERFLGAQDNPDDPIDYVIPKVERTTSPEVASLWDYFGLPTDGQWVNTNLLSINALPFRAYNRIWNEWFRDQNLQDSVPMITDNGPDNVTQYTMLRRGKRHDYFTACLPSPQKGAEIPMPLGGTAPILSTGQLITFTNNAQTRQAGLQMTSGSGVPTWSNADVAASSDATFGADGATVGSLEVSLADAVGASLNTMRVAIATQQLLERDARGGTRYVETVFAHWGVRPPDFRLDRPEYIGGGSSPVIVDAIPQTSATGLTGGDTPAGNLAATGSVRGKNGFSYAAVEHGYIIGLASVRAELTYSQGIRRHWSRETRYDYPYPEFAHLGEQAVLYKEIFANGDALDEGVFGYIPRYDECRHFPSMITGLYRPTAAANIAYWHSSEEFATRPELNSSFIQDVSDSVIYRNFSGGSATANQQFLCDFLFTGRVARPLPTHAVPGLNRF